MMNWVFGIMILIGLAYFTAAGRGADALTALASGCQGAITLTLSLAGTYMLWTGLFGIAEKAGLTEKLARLMKKPVEFLIPDAGDAAAPITLNLAANFLGLGSAATPFGVEAMRRLHRGGNTASPGMVMFIALNASALELLPASVIAVRTACGSASPYDIVLPTFIASLAASAAAIISCKALSRLFG
ncbi:MAG: nucleoside recognition protein [Clostridiales bacterium]|nr:nucleoside recognition protein [Clostridiales bacterium]